MVREVPALAVEMASSSLTPKPWKCSTCHEHYPLGCPALVRLCACGKLYDCANTECVGQRMKPQYCCYRDEPTVFPPAVTESAQTSTMGGADSLHNMHQQAQDIAGWAV